MPDILIILSTIMPVYVLGYEPADITVHPPPQKNYRGWVFFRIGV